MAYIFSVIKADNLVTTPDSVNIRIYVTDNTIGEQIINLMGDPVADMLMDGEEAQAYGQMFVDTAVIHE